MPKNDRYFCSKPFEWFEVTQLNDRGGVYLCCPSWLNTPVGNLQNESVDDIWNGETAQAIRRSILDGTFSYCNRNRCPYLQTDSGPVQRVDEVDDPDLKTIIKENLSVLPYGPKKIICTYDQSCNLSCPTCRAAVIVETNHRKEILDIQYKLQNEALKEADFLHITGSGDPFGSPFFRKWLQTMKLEDMPNLRHIHLHSNGQLWTPKMWETISEDVRQLVRSAEVSIDASTADTYAINRRGGEYGKLLENLEFISGLRKSGPLEYLKISMVVQANNFREMPGLVRLGRQLGVDTVYFSQLVNWGTFSNQEFRSRAVHLFPHPERGEFIQLLHDPLFDDPIVDLGNLMDLRSGTREHASRNFVQFTEKVWAKVQTYF